MPILGFNPAATITFGHKEDLMGDATAEYPMANTCSNSLRLPVVQAYAEFERNMNAALTMAVTFSLA